MRRFANLWQLLMVWTGSHEPGCRFGWKRRVCGCVWLKEELFIPSVCAGTLQVQNSQRLLDSHWVSLGGMDQWGHHTDIWAFCLKKKPILNSFLWFTLKFGSCGTGAELLEAAESCFLRISLGFSLHFPTLCMSTGVGFIYFSLNTG